MSYPPVWRPPREAPVPSLADAHPRVASARDAESQVAELIRANLDAARCLEQAALASGSHRLRIELNHLAHVRRTFSIELRTWCARRDAERPLAGSLSGALRQLWDEVVRLVEGGDDDALVIEQVERAEDRLRAAYEAALEATSELPIHRALRDHLARIESAREELAALADALQPAL